MNTELMFSSASVEWATPQALFDLLDNEFHFTLDAAANAANRKTPSYYGLDHPLPEFRDGLSGVWNGVVWCNPPYGRGIGAWVEKAWRSALDGATVVMLLPARIDTKWWFDHALHADEIRFIRGRLRFNDAGSAPFPSVVLVFRPPIAGMWTTPRVCWWATGDFKVNT